MNEKLWARYVNNDIPATRNQLGNLGNPYQTKARKVLCVCSAGLLRSPTLANVLHQEFEFNTRACGSILSFALIPLSEALIYWADEIVFVNMENYDQAIVTFNDRMHDKEIVVLDLPDQFSWNDPELKQHIKSQYRVANSFKHDSSKV